MATVQTVLGPVEAGQLDRVLMHEHLLCLLPGPWPYGGPRGPGAFDEEQVAFAVSALSGLAAYGVGTVADVSPYGDAGRDASGGNVVLLQKISRRSGLHVVAGTARTGPSSARRSPDRPPHPERCSVSGPPGMGCAGMIPLSWWHAKA